MEDTQIKHMVERFLCWQLPETFSPDAGISFDPVYNKGTPHEQRHQVSGTNLFCYTEAEAMVRHMVEDLPPSIRERQEYCPEHIASDNDPRVCGNCGIHINELAD